MIEITSVTLNNGLKIPQIGIGVFDRPAGGMPPLLSGEGSP
ncbi:MAG: hypothetical protein ACOX1Q_03605 [Eubacteriales bacterium]